MLDRRKPGQSSITTSRKESDKIQILSGLENNITLGTPISFLILNENTIKKDYSNFDQVPRPGHADLTYLMKYSIKSESGGGKNNIIVLIKTKKEDLQLEKQLQELQLVHLPKIIYQKN